MSRRSSVTGRGLGALVVGIASAALVVRCSRPAHRVVAPPLPAPTSTAAPPATAPMAPHAAAPASAPPPPAALPGSLEGTEPDGAIRADDAGHLVIDLELRRLFDHFLIASGEEPLAQIRARILAVLHARLPATAAAEATAILDRYLAYRDAARQLAPPPSDPRAGLAQLHDLRARMFAPEIVQAWFADEEAATHAALDRRDALLDPALSPAERERRLTEIDDRLPAAVREARAAATAPLDELNREQAMRAAGAGDDQIAAARTAAFGPEAAARLADLDRARAEWDARLARFRDARAALLADPRLDDAERGRRIAELLVRSFTPEERIRVDALDRIAAERAGP